VGVLEIKDLRYRIQAYPIDVIILAVLLIGEVMMMMTVTGEI
jgi:hypothetical protein